MPGLITAPGRPCNTRTHLIRHMLQSMLTLKHDHARTRTGKTSAGCVPYGDPTHKVTTTMLRDQRARRREQRRARAQKKHTEAENCALFEARKHNFGPWFARQVSALPLTPHKKGVAVHHYFRVFEAAQRTDPRCKCKRPWATAARRAGLSVAYLQHLESEEWKPHCGDWKTRQKIRRRVRGALALLTTLRRPRRVARKRH